METGGIDSVLPQGRREPLSDLARGLSISSPAVRLPCRGGSSMCPACLATAALVVAGATSAGGLTALAVNKLRARTGAPAIATIQPGGELAARKQHLAKEKELTRLRDELCRERRALPWVRVEKNYVFDGPDGKETLADLFGGRSGT